MIEHWPRLLAAVVIAAVVTITVAFMVSSAQSGLVPAQADDGNNTSVKVADNGKYGTYLDTHKLPDGRTITCLVAASGAGQSLSCDWSPQ